MKEQIIRFLQTSDGFVSGQEICNALGISRTAVWKYMNALREEGYEIESVTRKGYRLLQSPDLLRFQEIKAAIPGGLLGGEIRVFDTIDSTNEEAKRAALSGAPDGSLYVADNQSKGKGRRGRNWVSPKGKDIFFTLLLRPDLAPEDASMLTLVAALAGVNAAGRYTGADFQIKWPNDIIINGKKICGILTEMSLEMSEIDYVIVGIGWNLNRTEFDEDIKSMASSVLLETGHPVNRAGFLAVFVEEFMALYSRFLEQRDLGFCMGDYNRRLINIGREVKVIQKQEEFIYLSKGINERGELLVEDKQGNQKTILSGEVSVRGLYGYV